MDPVPGSSTYCSSNYTLKLRFSTVFRETQFSTKPQQPEVEPHPVTIILLFTAYA